MNILILGCGKLGQALALQLTTLGHSVCTVSRTAKDLPPSIQHITQDIQQLDLSNITQKFDWVYVILSPAQRSLFNYHQTYIDTIFPITQALQSHPIQKIVYISSTRVYGENQGQSVDDSTLPVPAPDDGYGQILRSAELLWHAHWQEKLLIIRPSGLYSGTSPRLLKMAQQLECVTEQHWINLIHQHDVVYLLAFLTNIQASELAESYIFTAEPALLQHHVLNHLRQQMQLPCIFVDERTLPYNGKKLSAAHLKVLLEKMDYCLQPIL